jgi:hypothetical protein
LCASPLQHSLNGCLFGEAFPAQIFYVSFLTGIPEKKGERLQLVQ